MANNQTQPSHHIATIIRTFLHATVIDDVQKNRIRLAGLPPLVQLLGGVILGLLGITTVLMIFASNLRTAFQTIVVSTDSYPNGLLLPSTAIGLVLFLLCMAWSFLLVAIQHSAWWIRTIGVFIHLFMIGIWIISLAQSNMALFGVVVAVLAVQTIIVLRQPHGHLVRNWVLIALCESILLALPHSIYLQQYQASGIGLLFTSVANFIQSQFAFITPMLFLVGISMAQAALNIADWGTRTAQYLNTRMVWAVLVICVVWRLFLIEERIFPSSDAILSALLYVSGFLAIVVCMRLTQPQYTPSSIQINDAIERGAPWLIVAYLVPLIVNIVAINVFGLVAMGAVVLGYESGAILDTVADFITKRSTEIQLTVAFGIGGYALVRWRRGAHLWGAFFGITAYHLAWRAGVNYVDLTIPTMLIEHVFFGGALVLTLVRSMCGVLTSAQLQGFLFVTICSVLLLNTDFLNNPLSPVLSFAGVIFIAIGVIWDVLFGSSWVNNDTPLYPRPVRLFFYLGYCLLMTIVAFWAVLSQDTWMTNLLTGESALLGLHVFATPALHLLYCIILFPPPTVHAVTALSSHDNTREV